MAEALKRLAATVYSRYPRREGRSSAFPFAEDRTRFFSYGRHALREALRLARVAPGDTVLFPEYICRDTLATVHSLGAKIAWYPVDPALRLAVSPESLPAARAVVAVNYFGFPQDLAPFHAYCNRTGAILIEDNAHGFLSRDAAGTYLGARGDIGIFSFRKSVPLPNGAGLLLNRPEKTLPLMPQLPYASYPKSRTSRMKRHLRRLAEWHMTGALYGLIGLDRALRKLRTGAGYVKSGADAETALPGAPEPDAGLPGALRQLDADAETERRRALYLATAELVQQHGGSPVFPELPEGVAPYGFPFRARPDAIAPIQRALRANCLDCHPWPELPSAIEAAAPERYTTVWLVSFIW